MIRVGILIFLLAVFPLLADGHGELYKSIGLSKILSKQAFDAAMDAHEKLKKAGRLKEPDIITIVDYSKPSKEKRFFVIDIRKHKLLFHEFVAHGKGSGIDRATAFGNGDGTHISSLGAYVTAETYFGKHGYSLALDGMDKGINNNARARAIVVHGAWYVSQKFVKQHGRTGRSWGCPALDEAISKKVIDTIKNGSLLYIWADIEAHKNVKD